MTAKDAIQNGKKLIMAMFKTLRNSNYSSFPRQKYPYMVT